MGGPQDGSGESREPSSTSASSGRGQERRARPPIPAPNPPRARGFPRDRCSASPALPAGEWGAPAEWRGGRCDYRVGVSASAASWGGGGSVAPHHATLEGGRLGLEITKEDPGRRIAGPSRSTEDRSPSGSQEAGRGGSATLSSGAPFTPYAVCAVWGSGDSLGGSADPKLEQVQV